MITMARRTSWLLIGAWALLAVLAGAASGGLVDDLADEDTAFLPQTGSALAFLEAERAAARADTDRRPSETAVVVVEGGQALTAAPVRAVASLRAELADGVPGVPVGDVGEVATSTDGRALAFEVDLRVDADSLAGAVDRLRQALRAALSAYPGVQGNVTGGAGVDADLAAGDVDLMLLLGSVAVVVLILVLVYRSPVLWVLPVVTGLAAVVVARGAVWVIAVAGVPVTELASSVVVVVVFGVSTDYSMLLLAKARRGAGHVAARTPILVSAGTVVAAVAALLLASLPGIRGLGAAVACGVMVAGTANLTLLPALLGVLPQRWQPTRAAVVGRGWEWVAARVGRRPVRVAVATATLLGAAAAGGILGWTTSPDPVANIDRSSDARQGLEALRRHFGAGADAPVRVLLPVETSITELTAELAERGATVLPGTVNRLGDRAVIDVVTSTVPYTGAWRAEVARLAEVVAAVAPGAVVGGEAVEAADREAAVRADLRRIAPVLVVAIAAVLAIWLRRLGVALVLVVGSCLSFGAAMGLSLPLFGLVGSTTSSAEVLLFGFVFLFAFGVDYLVFLMDEVRRLTVTGADPGTAVRRGLARTGPVITAAGLVLAATFSLLTFLPEINVRQLGLVVAVGVLVDTFCVRTFLVPAILLAVADRHHDDTASS